MLISIRENQFLQKVSKISYKLISFYYRKPEDPQRDIVRTLLRIFIKKIIYLKFLKRYFNNDNILIFFNKILRRLKKYLQNRNI